VEREKIESCIEAARLAPSAENVQPCRFLVLDDPDRISEFCGKAFSGIYRYTRWAAKAPVIIAMFIGLVTGKMNLTNVASRCDQWLNSKQLYTTAVEYLLADSNQQGRLATNYVLAQAETLSRQWLPKVKQKGIVLFHDIHEKREDFGVYKSFPSERKARS